MRDLVHGDLRDPSRWTLRRVNLFRTCNLRLDRHGVYSQNNETLQGSRLLSPLRAAALGSEAEISMRDNGASYRPFPPLDRTVIGCPSAQASNVLRPPTQAKQGSNECAQKHAEFCCILE